MRPRAIAVVLSLPALLACGGNVVVDGATGGSASSTTATTATGGAGGGACAKGMCPMFPPASGAACPCLGQTCPYDQCPVDGALTTATCDDGSWSLQSAMCESTEACGTTQCTPGFVCMQHIGGPIGSMPFVCIPNPCGTSPLSCSCATSVCPTGDGYTCAVMGSDLVCGCPLCK